MSDCRERIMHKKSNKTTNKGKRKLSFLLIDEAWKGHRCKKQKNKIQDLLQSDSQQNINGDKDEI